MKYDFNRVIDRSNNYSAKWSEMGVKYGKDDLIPMWVADMDFEAAPEIIEVMQKRLAQGIFGYTTRPESYNDSIANWMKSRHNWEIKNEWLLYSPGVIPSISLIIRHMTKPGDKIIIQQPVYSPFSSVVTDNGRQLVVNVLKKGSTGRYEMDFDDFENKVREGDVKLFLLCSPHNPVGRVWSRDELTRIGNICMKYNVKVIADEIHGDLVFKNHTHIPFASISETFAQNSITCIAPTKTFNIAGLQMSSVVLPNANDYKVLDEAFTLIDIKRNNCFSLVASEVAYNHGEAWLTEMLKYVEENMDYVVSYVQQYMPKVKVFKPEGTYLILLDFKDLGIDDETLKRILVEDAQVALNDGVSFGAGGDGRQRMNVACPKATVVEVLNRINVALSAHM